MKTLGRILDLASLALAILSLVKPGRVPVTMQQVGAVLLLVVLLLAVVVAVLLVRNQRKELYPL